jgi:hypothetical protein
VAEIVAEQAADATSGAGVARIGGGEQPNPLRHEAMRIGVWRQISVTACAVSASTAAGPRRQHHGGICRSRFQSG